MHKTAFNIGGLAIQVYGAGPATRILEIGAYDVNGSLRQHIGPDMQYVGVDLEAGPGVDIVVEPGKPLPFKDQSFDLILASSVFEHDPAFWATFLELIRVVRHGGYIYINAPSNGGFHRYPEDHWRFYPDSGMALERWAESQDRPVELVESFLCEQGEDNWNDFCAIFRRLPADGERPQEFVYSRVRAYNIHTWQSSELIRPQGETQDMLLLAAAQRAIEQQQHACQATQADLDRAREQIGAAEQRALATIDLAASQEKRLDSQAEDLRDSREQLAGLRQTISDHALEIGRLQGREQELAWLVEEREEERTRLVEEREEERTRLVEEREEERTRLVEEREEERARLVEEQKEQGDRLAQLAEERDRLHHALNHALQQVERLATARSSDIQGLTRTLADCQEEARNAAAKAESLNLQNAQHSRNAEQLGAALAEKSRQLAETETRLSDSEDRAAERGWLRHVYMVLASQPFWWCLLPPSWRQARELKLLLANGLFDADSYLAHYPDVAEFGMNPLRHYIWHGMTEGRRRHFR